jgi:hypothetical protein
MGITRRSATAREIKVRLRKLTARVPQRLRLWYVGGLSGVITIPAFGLDGQDYGLSGWTLFGPGVPGVPDGGTTVMLLGAALGALGMARRFLKR